jgi:hypothetical protein
MIYIFFMIQYYMLSECKACSRKLTKNNKRCNRSICRKCEYLIRKIKHKHSLVPYKPKHYNCTICGIERNDTTFKRIHGARCISCFKKITRQKFLARYYRNNIPIRYKNRTSKIICTSIHSHFKHIERMNKPLVLRLIYYIQY